MLLATAFADPPCVAGLAAFFTLAAERSIARAAAAGRDALRAEERRHTLAGAAIGLWVALCCAYPAWEAPAWMLSYAERLRWTPTLVWYPVFALGLMASGALGAFLSFLCLARLDARLARMIAAGFLAIWLTLFAATLPRALVAGTWEQFDKGQAQPLLARPGFLLAVALCFALDAAGLCTAFALRLRGERAAPPA